MGCTIAGGCKSTQPVRKNKRPGVSIRNHTGTRIFSLVMLKLAFHRRRRERVRFEQRAGRVRWKCHQFRTFTIASEPCFELPCENRARWVGGLVLRSILGVRIAGDHVHRGGAWRCGLKIEHPLGTPRVPSKQSHT